MLRPLNASRFCAQTCVRFGVRFCAQSVQHDNAVVCYNSWRLLLSAKRWLGRSEHTGFISLSHRAENWVNGAVCRHSAFCRSLCLFWPPHKTVYKIWFSTKQQENRKNCPKIVWQISIKFRVPLDSKPIQNQVRKYSPSRNNRMSKLTTHRCKFERFIHSQSFQWFWTIEKKNSNFKLRWHSTGGDSGVQRTIVCRYV